MSSSHQRRPQSIELRRYLTISVTLVAFFITLLILFGGYQIDQERRFQLRETSLRLADSLRQSSDDLSSTVHSYLVTGDSKYKSAFEEILAIRNGTVGIPLDYDNTYWTIKQGVEINTQRESAKSYMSSVLDHGFTKDEVKSLMEALDLSNTLTETEFHAMKAAESAKTSDDRLKAVFMVEDASYHQTKSKIMEAIRSFNHQVEQRTHQSIRQIDQILVVLRLAIALSGALMLISIARLFGATKSAASQSAEILESYASIVEHSNDVIIGMDLNGIVTEWNHSAEKMFGYSHKEMLGQSIRLLIPKELIAEEEGLLKRLGTGELIDHFETRRRHRDGHDIPSSITFSPIRNNRGQTVGISKIMRDISAQKRIAEQIIAATKAKSDFLACMSHEIRTPLNAILGFAQLLEKAPLTQDQHRMIDKINSSGRSLIHIINDILDFSRIEAGQLRLEIKPFDIDLVIRHVVSIHAHACEMKGVTFKLIHQFGTINPLIGDADRLEQILNNLLANAVKFTSQGEVTLHVEQLHPPGKPSSVRLVIEDTGIGIESHSLQQLFTPFTQADASTTRRFGGSGLGLSICKRLVEQMHGEINAESQLEKGSRFWVDIPFEAGPSIPDITTTPHADKKLMNSTKRLTGLVALIADDSEVNLMVTRQLLESEGAEVLTAENGKILLEKLAIAFHRIHIILTDINMPIMDGLTATRAIRKDSRFDGIPVIALTAGILDDERVAALSAGIDDFVEKPVHLARLIDVLAPFSAKTETSYPNRPSQQATEATQLPLIEGIDPQIAVENTMGNIPFFKTVIQIFLRDFEFIIAHVQEDLERSDQDAAIRKLHKLNGSADQIGATRLSIAAHDAEILLADPSRLEELQPALSSLDLQVRNLASSARAAFASLGS